MQRKQKEQLVDSLHQALDGKTLVVVTHQTGLTVAQMTELRQQVREAQAGFKVTKNRLAKLAIAGTQFETLSDMFTGPTAIAYSEDPVAAAKVVVNYANKNDKLVVLGGALGEKVLSADDVKALARLPSLDELRGTIVGLIQAPATRVAQVLNAPGSQLARVFAAYGSSGSTD